MYKWPTNCFLLVYVFFVWLYILIGPKITVKPIVKRCQIIQICILFKYLKVGLNIIVLCIKGPWIGVCNNRLNRNVRVCVNCDPSEFLPTLPLPPIYFFPLFLIKPLNPYPQFLLAKPPFSSFMPAEYDYLYAGLRNMFYILPPPATNTRKYPYFPHQNDNFPIFSLFFEAFLCWPIDL